MMRLKTYDLQRPSNEHLVGVHSQPFGDKFFYSLIRKMFKPKNKLKRVVNDKTAVLIISKESLI